MYTKNDCLVFCQTETLKKHSYFWQSHQVVIRLENLPLFSNVELDKHKREKWLAADTALGRCSQLASNQLYLTIYAKDKAINDLCAMPQK